MDNDIVVISDSDDEAAPPSSASSSNKASTSIQQAKCSTSSSILATPASLDNLDIKPQPCFDSETGMMVYKPLGADLAISRQAEAMKKKKLSIMEPFPVVKEVVNKMRSALGTNDSQLKVMGLAQNYISSLKHYQSTIVKCPNRCRLLARHITQTMCLIRDLSRHFIDSPHYSQKVCELLAIYIYFELQSAADFKDSKIKIAERIIHNIHLHLENAQSNFVLRIFAFLSNMGKEKEIATKVFQRLIPEPTIMVKNEFPDRLFVQYLIVFYHWKEAWNDYEDQQKVVAFANKFMKPMSTIKTNKLYARHLPCYVRRDDATGYFLTNMVFFNDLRNASILDGVQENGPTLIDLSDDDRVFPIIDLSDSTMIPVAPLINNIKIEPLDADETVDLTNDDEDTWIKKLIRRAVALEVMLPAILTTRREDQAPAVVDLNDSDNENANNNDDENDDDAWAFGPNNAQPAEVVNQPPVVEEESNSMDDIYNELNSSIDFGDDSTTESEKVRKREQKQRFDVASKLTDAQVRITFEGVVERELQALSIQQPHTSKAAKAADKPSTSNLVSASITPTSSSTVVSSEKQNSSKAALVSKASTSLKVTDVVENTMSVKSDATNEKLILSNENVAPKEPLITNEQLTLSIPTIQEGQQNFNINDKEVSTKAKTKKDEQKTNTVGKDRSIKTTLDETQAPKESVTLSIEQSLSSFDSDDESDEDFLGRYQKPPLKTYLRRAHRKSTNKEIISVPSGLNCWSEEDENSDVEKLPQGEINSNEQSKSPTVATLDAKDTSNVLFSGKVISLREDDGSYGGYAATPTYLKEPESVEISKHGSNVVFSMSGRNLSSFPALRITSNDQAMPDFDVEHSTGEDDSNSRIDEISNMNKSTKKSSISSKKKIQKNLEADKQNGKAKSVWFAEKHQVREIECRKLTPSPQKTSSINSINSSINNIIESNQHSPSTTTSTTTKSTINSSESYKTSKFNHISQNRSISKSTESQASTAALKSAQEKDLLQKLFPEVFNIAAKSDQKIAPKKPALIKVAISNAFNSKSNNKNNISTEMNNRKKSATSVSVAASINNKSFDIDNLRKPMSTVKQAQSDFDKYLERKKLTKPSKAAKPKASLNTKSVLPKTETTKPKRSNKSKKTPAVITNDSKLGSNVKPIVVVDRVAGPVFIFRSNLKSETFTEVCPGLFKLKQLPSKIETAKKIVDVRTKSLSDILSDVVVQEITSLPIGNEKSLNEPSCGNVKKQFEFRPSPVPVLVNQEVLALQEKEKMEEDKLDQRKDPEILPLRIVEVKSQDELELKQIKKEEMESKSPSPEMAPSKPASDCFKKPLKSMASKRLASSSFIHGTARYVKALKDRPEVAGSSSEVLSNRLEVEEPVSSTNIQFRPSLISESESDSSCRTEKTVDIESSEHSDSSQSLSSPTKTLKVKLRRQSRVLHYTEHNGNATENAMKVFDGEKKRRGRKSLVKKGEALKRIFEKADSSIPTTSKNLDQEPPQSGLINGVLVPSIEAMNTPPPTPPTTADDKNSVADDSSQEAKSQTAAEPNNRVHPPVVFENGETVQVDKPNIHIQPPVTLPINKTSKIFKNHHLEANFDQPLLQTGEKEIFSLKSPFRQRRRFESVNLPTANNKRSRKQSTTEFGGDTLANNICRGMVKKRRKTICTDIFNPPDFSFDEEICSAEAAVESPTREVMLMHSFGRVIKPSTTLSTSTTKVNQEKQLNDKEISVPSEPLVDSTLHSSTFTRENPSANSTTISESQNLESDGNNCSSRTNCDSPVVATSRNLAVSRTYSKNNMVQQVFVPPDIEIYIEEPTKFVVEKPTSAKLPNSTSARATRRKNSSIRTKKSGKMYTTSEEEDCASQDSDYQQVPRKTTKKMNRGKKRGASRGKCQ